MMKVCQVEQKTTTTSRIQVDYIIIIIGVKKKAIDEGMKKRKGKVQVGSRKCS
jgi:hypothetical protein